MLNIRKSAFPGYRKIFWTAPTSSASHPKSSVHNVSQVITAFMQQTDSCAHFAKSSGIGSAQKLAKYTQSKPTQRYNYGKAFR